MADITVAQLASTLEISPARMLESLRQARLPHEDDDEIVSDRQQLQFLEFIRNGQKAASKEQQRTITIRRRSSLRRSAQPTVTVQTRRKKVFVRTVEPTESPPAASAPALSKPDAATTGGHAPTASPCSLDSDESEQRRIRLDRALEVLRLGLARTYDTCDGDDLAAMLKRLIKRFPELEAPYDAPYYLLTLLHAALDARNLICHYRPELLAQGRALYFLAAIRQLCLALDKPEGGEVHRLYLQQLDAEAAKANDETGDSS